MTESLPPEGELLAFVQGLPSTINESILLFANLYAAPDQEPVHLGAATRIAKELQTKDGLVSFGAVLRWRGVIDFVIRRMVHDAATQQAKLEHLRQSDAGALADAPAILNHIAAAQPLASRHLAAAARRWENLLTGPLSDQALWAEETRRCQRPGHI
ncbi:hypothetical protein J2792_002375 [Novosphingobium capsulatum]|uniref:Uncharacterized protein n=1 Tax=Novosphingobium capsulatum TaxID=13688 RepID=A0ABU1MMD0_9SPHN|nr:hypothetical protein [Novosphingobium capsulatum]MDR6511503.1 hypothetical protein [Novosphingobium capsulatum]